VAFLFLFSRCSLQPLETMFLARATARVSDSITQVNSRLFSYFCPSKASKTQYKIQLFSPKASGTASGGVPPLAGDVQALAKTLGTMVANTRILCSVYWLS